MSHSGPHHWLPLPSPTLGADSDPRERKALSAFLAGPENRIAETAVYWAIGGVPFFSDSPESAALSEEVRSAQPLDAFLPLPPEDGAKNIRSQDRGKKGKNAQSAPKSSGDAPSFWRSSYPIPPDENGDVPQIIDYMPMVNIPNLSPLVFYGPSGSGKSHLAGGIYWEFRKRNPRKGGIFLNADEFYRSLTDAVSRNQTVKFRRYFSDCRIVVLDNVDELENRPIGCDELSALLRICEESGILAVLTLSKYPGDAVGLPEALRARLGGGLLVPVVFPEPMSRRILLRRFAEAFGIKLAPEVEDFMTDRFPKPAGEFYGLFSQMFHLGQWSKTPPTIPQIRDFLSRRQTKNPISLDAVVKATAGAFAVRAADMKSKSRLKTIVSARNMAIYIARQTTSITLTELGRYFSGRDHATVLHGLRKMEERLADDDELKKIFRQIMSELDKKVKIEKENLS